MPIKISRTTSLRDIANALRNKAFTEEELIFPEGFINILESIPGVESILDKSISTFKSDTLTTVDKYAFSNCKNLCSVIIPNVASIEQNAFQDCTSLESVILPAATYMNGNAFLRCTNLKYIEFGSKLDIPMGAFSNCNSLEALVLRSPEVCTLKATSAFTNSGIANGTGYIYVPLVLLQYYMQETNWITYANQFRVIEGSEYEITGGTE